MQIVTHITCVFLLAGIHGNPMVDIHYEPEASNAKLSHKLEAIKTEIGKDGEPFMMSVSVPDHVTIEMCTWRREGMSPLFLKKEGLFDYRRNRIQGITALASDKRNCSISIDHLSSSDHGIWTSRVYHSGGKKWQEAHFHVSSSQKKEKDDIYVRLPTNIKPSRYEVFLIPFLIPDNFTIAGEVNIDADITDPTTNITLHINDITIHEDEVTVTTIDDNSVTIVGHGYDELRQFYIINLDQELSQTSVKIHIKWTGNLNDELAGFYRSSYTDEDGNTKYIATTQFEATDARRALPCFDEPAMKAVFQINLGRLPEMSSISNMPIADEGVPIGETGYVWDVYQDSLKMSTYLLAFIVSDFVYRTSEPQPNGVEFRIWSREAAKDQTVWASEIGPTILAYYETYFNTSFPLPKQDMIAIPDFSAGAMENWGLITYREVALLYEPGKSSLSDKEYVAIVVAHELAHQWFGDLVTMEWWTDLWLNEGFASYTEYIGAFYVSPETEILDRFVLDTVQSALGYDSLTSSHPISVPVNVPDEINEIFDTISYQKGGSVIRMMANFLGVETFNKGITNYLHAYAYTNANQDDLWGFLTAAGQEDGTLLDLTVKQIMDTWTVQMGYPVLTFSRNFVSNEASASQSRFLLTPVPDNSNETDTNDYTWWIPVSMTTPTLGFDKTSPNTWLDPAQADTPTTIDLSPLAASESEPVIVNVQQTGFYRVNYDQRNWELISEALINDHEKIHRINRAQILDDSLNLARADVLEYPTALKTTEYLTKETDFIPWSSAITAFVYLEDMMKRSAGFGELKHYLLDTLQPLYNRLGFQEIEGEKFLDEKLRIIMLKIMCRLGHQECNEYSGYLLDEWMSEPDPDAVNPVPLSIRETVLCSGIAGGNETHWNFLWTRYKNSDNGNVKNVIMSALACSQEVWILEKYLEMALDESSGVRKQDGYRIVVGVSKNLIGRYLAWNWIRDKWEDISSYYDTAISSSVSRMITAVANDFNTPLELSELQTFIADHETELGTAGSAAEQMVESTKANIIWMEKHYQTIVDWLEN